MQILLANAKIMFERADREATSIPMFQSVANDFKTKFLSSQLGCARLSFAGEEHMIELLHIHLGAVS